MPYLPTSHLLTLTPTAMLKEPVSSLCGPLCVPLAPGMTHFGAQGGLETRMEGPQTAAAKATVASPAFCSHNLPNCLEIRSNASQKRCFPNETLGPSQRHKYWCPSRTLSLLSPLLAHHLHSAGPLLLVPLCPHPRARSPGARGGEGHAGVQKRVQFHVFQQLPRGPPEWCVGANTGHKTPPSPPPPPTGGVKDVSALWACTWWWLEGSH